MAVQIPSVALVKRELMSNLRRVVSFLCVLLFVGIAMAFAVGMWPKSSDITWAAISSRALFMVFTNLLLAGSMMFIPSLAASTISAEKEQQTFDLLIMTLIRPSGILAAKLLNTVGFLVLLAVAVMPVFGVTFFLVGFDWRQVWVAVAVIMATTFSCASVGILSSALFRRRFVAVMGAYLGVAAITLGPSFLATFGGMAMFGIRGMGDLMEVCAVTTFPFATLNMVLQGMGSSSYLVLALAYHGAVVGVCSFLTLLILRRPPAPPKVDYRKPIDDPAVLRRRKYYWLIDPLKRKKPIEDNRNPMLVKELRWGMMGRGTAMVRVFYISLIVYFLGGVSGVYLEHSFMNLLPWIVFQMAITAAVAPALMANILTKEFELGNMDMLRSTLLTPRGIMLGKGFAGFAIASPAMLAAVASAIPLVFLGLSGREWQLLLTGYVTLCLCVAISSSIGLFSSVLTRRTSTSLALSYFLSATVFVGIPAVLGVLYELRVSFFKELDEEVICFLSPIIAFIENAAEITGRNDSPITFYWVANVALYAALVVLLVTVSVRIFSRYRMSDR